jgi:hypothetical protein
MEKQVASKVKSRRGKPAPSRMDGRSSEGVDPRPLRITSTDESGRTVSESRHERIAEAAYYLAEKRGFEPGKELEDWREAESRIDRSAGGSDAAH